MGVVLGLAAMALAVATATAAVRADSATAAVRADSATAAVRADSATAEGELGRTSEPPVEDGAGGSAPGEDGGAGEPGTPSVPELVSPAAESVVLTWDAPAGCPDAAAVRRALAGYLGEGPSIEAGAAVRAEARVTRRGAAYELVLRTETASGTTSRETTATDCAVLVDATAVIVAIAVDPSTILARGAAAPEPIDPQPTEPEPSEPVPAEPTEPEPSQPPEPTPPVEAAPEPAAPVEPRVRYGMRVAGGADFGVLPGLAGGMRLTGATFGRGWRAELRGDFWLPRTATLEAGISARVSLWSLGARGCWVPRADPVRLEFPLCAGLESGAMRGDPIGDRIASPTPSSRFWLAADGSAGLAWSPLRFLALVVQAELVVPIVRAGFRIGDDTELHRAGPVAGRALLGVEARFP
jgi:hypothetical protein